MSKLALDGHKLFYHLDRLIPWLNGEEVYPIYASIGPSRLCNHRCIFCAYGYLEKNKTLMEKRFALRIIDECAEAGIRSMFFSGDGEPLCNPHTPHLIERGLTPATAAGIVSVFSLAAGLGGVRICQ